MKEIINVPVIGRIWEENHGPWRSVCEFQREWMNESKCRILHGVIYVGGDVWATIEYWQMGMNTAWDSTIRERYSSSSSSSSFDNWQCELWWCLSNPTKQNSKKFIFDLMYSTQDSIWYLSFLLHFLFHIFWWGAELVSYSLLQIWSDIFVRISIISLTM